MLIKFSSIASESALKEIKTIARAVAAPSILFETSEAQACPCWVAQIIVVPLLLRRQTPNAICRLVSWVMGGRNLVLLTQSVSRSSQKLPESPEVISDSHKAPVILQ